MKAKGVSMTDQNDIADMAISSKVMAKKLLEQAYLGDAGLQNKVAALLATGNDQPDKEAPAAAVYWYVQACKQGLYESKWNLSTMLFLGEGVNANVNLAVLLMKEAAEEGSIDACKFLAECYADGFGGFDIDSVASQYWAQKSQYWEQKNQEKRQDYELSDFGMPIDVEKALKLKLHCPDDKIFLALFDD